MKPPHALAAEVRRAINTDILEATGLSPTNPLRALFRPLAWPPTHLFARLAAEFDHHVAESGLMKAISWALPRFVDDVRAFGTKYIPSTGPLVIVSNHPGAYDGMVIAASLPREDLKIVVTDRPFFRSLRAASSHFIYTPRDTPGRMGVVRQAVRHLQEGGSLLIFAQGQVEPDPAVTPGAEEALEGWSPSVPLFLRRVPGASLMVTIVSGVLSPSALQHPLARLQEGWRERQLLAELVQISQQMLFKRRFQLVPAVRFAPPLTASDVGKGHDASASLRVILDRAKELLADV